MGESGRLPERFAAAFLFCPQRRISGAFRTPHRGLRFVIALANTTSISCGRFRAQLRAATSASAPYIRLCGQTFPSLCYALYRYGKYRSAALGMTNIQKPSPALSPRSVLCGRLFFFYTISFSDALLRAATSDSADRLFPSLCYDLCRYGKYRSAARFSRVGRSRYARKIRRYL